MPCYSEKGLFHAFDSPGPPAGLTLRASASPPSKTPPPLDVFRLQPPHFFGLPEALPRTGALHLLSARSQAPPRPASFAGKLAYSVKHTSSLPASYCLFDSAAPPAASPFGLRFAPSKSKRPTWATPPHFSSLAAFHCRGSRSVTSAPASRSTSRGITSVR